MSADFFIFTEAKVKGKWYAIGGDVPHFVKTDEGLSLEMRPTETYWNGSRSYFGETYDKLRNIGRAGRFSELSEVVQRLFHSSVEHEEDGELLYSDVIIVDYGVFRKYAETSEHDRHGFVHKDAIFAFENGESEELWSTDYEDIAELSKEEKRQYRYYEWDDPYGWLCHFKDIKSAAENEVSKFSNANLFVDIGEYRLVVIRC